MPLYRDEGIVVLLTRGRGKVRAVAKGVRKTSSRFGARLEAPSHVALQLYEGRELDTITQAESIDHFRAIRDDLDLITRAASMLEAADHMSPEREPNPRLYAMLLGALRTLASDSHPLVTPSFFWKLLALEGFRPVVDTCATCGTAEGLVAFDLDEGGMLCAQHRRGVSLSAPALGLLQLILGGRVAAALSTPVTPATAEVEHLATRAMEHHLERRLRAVGVLGH
ncbi:MAG: DNA repair protein RecO [Acidimicrobiales bacterium]